jgi:hypothetical protein
MNRRQAAALACFVVWSIAASPAVAADRYALVVSGASGEQKYAERYDEWRTKLVNLLADRFGYGRDRVFALGEKPTARVQLASRENVRRTLGALAARVRAEDLLLIVLIGHGTFDGTAAKFNLVGPDLDASEWAALLRPFSGRLVVVNSTSASYAFLPALSRRNRVVITATDSRAARYDTVFPEYFIKAMEQAAAESGRDGRVSIWDVFTTASEGVKRYYEQRGLLPVEHALLDDAGDGFGKEADQPGTDPSFAQSVYLNGNSEETAMDAATRSLSDRRDDLIAQVGRLKERKTSMPQSDYEAQLEKLLVELAKVSRELRTKGAAK